MSSSELLLSALMAVCEGFLLFCLLQTVRTMYKAICNWAWTKQVWVTLDWTRFPVIEIWSCLTFKGVILNSCLSRLSVRSVYNLPYCRDALNSNFAPQYHQPAVVGKCAGPPLFWDLTQRRCRDAVVCTVRWKWWHWKVAPHLQA